jgi:hypothetical protein
MARISAISAPPKVISFSRSAISALDFGISARNGGSTSTRTTSLLRVGIDEDFHETVGLALFEGAGDILHGDLAHERTAAAPPNLGLGHAGPAERRVGIERIGGDAIADPSAFAVEQVGRHDLEVVVGGMGEGAAPVAVAQRPDARHIG